MRGKALHWVLTHLPPGITPACAGKSKKRHLGGWKKGDHPRVCGEKLRLCEFLLSSLGSPPRVRGKAASACLTSFQTGITPACAGKSLWPLVLFASSRDHPRVCGEKLFFLLCGGDTWGSPPRVRGKEKTMCAILHDYRITPACAGKRRKEEARRNPG